MRALLILILAAAPLSAQTLAIVNGTVITVTKGTFKGSVLVRDGKIAEVGEKVLIPGGVKVIDAAGRYVMP
jgi:imidazolonepropionase-like amidohydrolase